MVQVFGWEIVHWNKRTFVYEIFVRWHYSIGRTSYSRSHVVFWWAPKTFTMEDNVRKVHDLLLETEGAWDNWDRRYVKRRVGSYSTWNIRHEKAKYTMGAAFPHFEQQALRESTSTTTTKNTVTCYLRAIPKSFCFTSWPSKNYRLVEKFLHSK